MREIKNVDIKDMKKYEAKDIFSGEKLKNAVSDALKKVDYMMETLGDKFAASASKNNVYEAVDNLSYPDWNQGFWSGILWLSWELTGEDKYKELALSHLSSFRQRIVEKHGVNHHDMGFLYTPSCVAAYRLTGNEYAKETALLAADNLLSRFHEKGGFIQAWGDLGAPENYRLIVDCLLNVPLLYWATEITGDEKYKKAGYTHFRTTLENAIREDATTYHTFYFDPQTGAPVKGVTAQGVSDDSCWARGQAWGIYGLIMTAKYIKDPDAVELCRKLTNSFLNRLPKDYVPFWDMVFTDGADEPRDSSSSAIAVCGMLELIKYLSADATQVYKNAVGLIMDSLYENYSTKDTPHSNGLLLHATYSKPHGNGVDECNIWGCYFYMEALTRLSKDWKMYW